MFVESDTEEKCETIEECLERIITLSCEDELMFLVDVCPIFLNIQLITLKNF